MLEAILGLSLAVQEPPNRVPLEPPAQVAPATPKETFERGPILEPFPTSALLLEATYREPTVLTNSTTFNGLEREQQKKVTHLYGFLEGHGQGREALVGLMEGGGLAATDTRGVPLLETLDQMSRQQFAQEGQESLDPRQTVSELVQQLEDPGLIHQSNRETCGPTTVEYWLAKQKPAEYARVVAGLTSPEGRVVLADGQEIERDRFNLGPDDSTRSGVSRLFQSSAMEHINQGFDYRNDLDHHVYVVDRGDPTTQDDDLALPDGRGLLLDEGARLLGSFLGEEVQFARGPASNNGAGRAFDPGTVGKDGSTSWRQDLSDATSDSRASLAFLDWDIEGSSHIVAVTGLDQDFVYLRDPEGDYDVPNPDGSRPGPIHFNDPDGDKGSFKMPIAEFESRLRSYSYQNPR